MQKAFKQVGNNLVSQIGIEKEIAGRSIKNLNSNDKNTKADAHYFVGLMHYFGMPIQNPHLPSSGTAENIEKAIEFFVAAASLDQADAHYMLGVCHENGYGLFAINLQKAIYHYRVAAKDGNTNAQFNLAVCLEREAPCAASKEDAEKLASETLANYQLAANSGHADAQHNLAVCYEEGFGLEQKASGEVAAQIVVLKKDTTKASYWYERSIKTQYGYEHYQAAMPELVDFAGRLKQIQARQKSGIEFGDRLETPADLMGHEDYYRTKAMQVNPDAAHTEAMLYELTTSLDRSLYKARTCLQQATLYGHEMAASRLNALGPIEPLQEYILQGFLKYKLTEAKNLSSLVAEYAFEEEPKKRSTIKERDI